MNYIVFIKFNDNNNNNFNNIIIKLNNKSIRLPEIHKSNTDENKNSKNLVFNSEIEKKLNKSKK